MTADVTPTDEPSRPDKLWLNIAHRHEGGIGNLCTKCGLPGDDQVHSPVNALLLLAERGLRRG